MQSPIDADETLRRERQRLGLHYATRVEVWRSCRLAFWGDLLDLAPQRRLHLLWLVSHLLQICARRSWVASHTEGVDKWAGHFRCYGRAVDAAY